MRILFVLMLSFFTGSSFALPPELKWCLEYDPTHSSTGAMSSEEPSIEFMQILAEKAEFTLLQNNNIPFSRCLKMMAMGQQDIMFSLNKDPEREAYMYFFPLYAAVPEKLFCRIGNCPTLNEIADAKRYVIASVRGHVFNSHDALIIQQHNTMVEIKSIEDGLAMLLQDRVDFVLAPQRSTEISITTTPQFKDKIKSAKVSLAKSQHSNVHLAVSRVSDIPPAVLINIANVLKEMKQSGQIERLLSPHDLP
jgi:polar amino acid transport system substrate-binding protein